MLLEVLAKSEVEKAFAHRLVHILDQSIGSRLDLLPWLTCESAGGNRDQAAPLVSAWRALRLSAKFLDDVTDGESAHAPAEIINLATGLLFLASRTLTKLGENGVSCRGIERLMDALHEAGLHACAGQQAEWASPDMDPDTWLAIAQAKSGEPFAWASWAGAVIADGSEQALAGFRDYGLHLGVLVQVADDFNGIWNSGEINDLRSEGPNLAVCYARLVAEREQRAHLETLLVNARNGDRTAERDIQQLLVDMAAQAYLLVVGREQRQQALAALSDNAPLPLSLVGLLDHVWPALSKATSENLSDGKRT